MDINKETKEQLEKNLQWLMDMFLKHMTDIVELTSFKCHSIPRPAWNHCTENPKHLPFDIMHSYDENWLTCNRFCSLDVLKPVTFISGKYLTTQCNHVDLVREEFTFYMSVKRLSLYLQDKECTILCNHKPCEKFLKGKTENNKVNNGSGELSSYKLNIQYIKGTKMCYLTAYHDWYMPN